MKVFQDVQEITPDAKNCVVVIGNFDGIHRGHQALLNKAKLLAAQEGKKLAVLTFEPHPRQLFRPDEPPSRITPFPLKAWRMEQEGVELLFSLPFNWDFASQSAAAFVQNILVEALAASHVVVGYDFRFGQLRAGTPDTIREAGMAVTVVEEIKAEQGEDLSSSRIRQLLRHGKIDEANKLLGWDWEIRGEVFQGDQRGRELGYPTANMRMEDVIHPAYGVYAVLVQIEGEDHWRMGATNIGIRPMFEVKIAQVETYIFDFSGDLYGKTLRVRPVTRLRGEAKFQSIEHLIRQIKDDCTQSRHLLEQATRAGNC